MYTQQDRKEIVRRIRKYSIITAVAFAVVMVFYVLGLINRWEWPVIGLGCLLFAVVCFGWIAFIWPSIRYWQFLRDMEKGLTRKIVGTIVEVAGQEDLQDGVRVLPVRVLLDEEQDERIVYVNASKTENFPKAGAHVQLSCYGRHIREYIAG